MRELILRRIETIRIKEDYFLGTKWNSLSLGTLNCDANSLNYNDMNDVELLLIFERIIRIHNENI